MAEKSAFSGVLQNEVSRRKFLETSLKVLLGVAALELGAAGFMFLRARSLEGKFGGIITAGNIEDFTAGSVVEFEEENFYLLVAQNRVSWPSTAAAPTWAAPSTGWLPKKSSSAPATPPASTPTATASPPWSPAPWIPSVFFEEGLVKVDTSKVVSRERHLPQHFSYAG